jgi:hypothetical protein
MESLTWCVCCVACLLHSPEVLRPLRSLLLLCQQHTRSGTRSVTELVAHVSNAPTSFLLTVVVALYSELSLQLVG